MNTTHAFGAPRNSPHLQVRHPTRWGPARHRGISAVAALAAALAMPLVACHSGSNPWAQTSTRTGAPTGQTRASAATPSPGWAATGPSAEPAAPTHPPKRSTAPHAGPRPVQHPAGPPPPGQDVATHGRVPLPRALDPFSCAAAIAYLSAHEAPGFTAYCPAYAYGNQAETCWNHPPQCAPGSRVILIADPCPAAYRNEANNSWVLLGLRAGQIDPYGSCAA